jgi:hypothetical protein
MGGRTVAQSGNHLCVSDAIEGEVSKIAVSADSPEIPKANNVLQLYFRK